MLLLLLLVIIISCYYCHLYMCNLDVPLNIFPTIFLSIYFLQQHSRVFSKFKSLLESQLKLEERQTLNLLVPELSVF